MMQGTCHFVSVRAANSYYRHQEGNAASARKVVRQKIAEGLIQIGPPTVKPGQKLIVISGEGRYGIEE